MTYKIRLPKKCPYKGTIASTRHNRNPNIPEELERIRRKDARWETTKTST
jgi:hypothetical protein